MTKLYKAIGLMSGTSMDGIDLSFIESDGKKIINQKGHSYLAYDLDFKKRLQNIIYNQPTLEEVKLVEDELTKLHAKITNEFLKTNNIKADEIDLIAFHGHTILHKPHEGKTWQIGNGNLLANLCQINVVGDFRSNDVDNNGQGAPLVPIYHFNLLQKDNTPIAVLNIGGISNITYFDDNNENNIRAFDVSFGNAPLDDLVKVKLDLEYDEDGKLASNGEIDILLADRILKNEIFHLSPPKSFDRDDFKEMIAPITNLETKDALATFSYIHAKAIEINLNFLTQIPKILYICGGGRKNKSLVEQLKKHLQKTDVKIIEEIGLNGDTIESEAFAYLGIRSILNLPISFPKTTGVDKGKGFGGVLYKV